jgi:hypothetical protein
MASPKSSCLFCQAPLKEKRKNQINYCSEMCKDTHHITQINQKWVSRGHSKSSNAEKNTKHPWLKKFQDMA